MMLKSFIFLMVLLMMAANAEINDLEKLIKELEEKPMSMKPLVLPQLQIIFENYKPAERNNIFDGTRSSSYDINSYSYNQDYSLNQLQMVGYMNYAGVAYAFLKSPFETMKVKIGDQLKGGSVVNISSTSIEIDQLQVIDNKSYKKKIYIELIQLDNNKRKMTIK